MTTVRDRSNGSEGSIQHLPGHLLTSDPAANSGAHDAYVSDGKQQDSTPADFQGHVCQNPPALKADSARVPVVARLDKTSATITARGSGFGKNAGVKSHPALMRAHQTGSITHADHKNTHGVVKSDGFDETGAEMILRTGDGEEKASGSSAGIGEPESGGALMPRPSTPVVAKLSRGYAELGQPISKGPVVATPSGGPMRSR